MYRRWLYSWAVLNRVDEDLRRAMDRFEKKTGINLAVEELERTPSYAR